MGECVMKVFFNVTLTLISMVLQLILLTSLWGWFVVPLGVVSIGYAHAFGLNLLLTYFQIRNPRVFKPDLLIERTYGKKISNNIFIMLTALLLGYIASSLM
jgi:hypothetical protein